MKVIRHKRALTLGVALLLVAAARPAAGLLTDMAAHWAAPLVGALEARGTISGDEDLQFHPDRPLTRAQLAKLLTGGLGHLEDALLLGAYPSRFADVPRWHWANGLIESLAETGAVEGYPDGRFGPEDEVTRAQLSVIFVRISGLADQARSMRFEHTTFADDAEVPDWARGYVHVARTAGLMAGFEDNTFRPNLPVTRAEGATALFRLLAAKGRMHHLSGTLLRFDPITRQGTVRDAVGREADFTMTLTAQYYRAGAPAYSGLIRPLDQVWITLGPEGTGIFMDARFSDRMIKNVQVQRNLLSGVLPSGGPLAVSVGPGTLVFLNGKTASLSEVAGATVAYLALDHVTAQARVVDALAVSGAGLFVATYSNPGTIVMEVETEISMLPLAADVAYVLNGQPVEPGDLRPGDRLQVVKNEAGAVTYVLAER